MTNIWMQNTRSNSLTASTTYYFSIGSNGGNLETTEALNQITWRNAGTFSNMYCRVRTHSAGTATVVTYRVGGANGNQTISISGSATGEFTDSTDTDISSSGNQINFQTAVGTGGLATTIYGGQFAPTTTTNTINKLGCNGTLTDTSVNTTYYNCLVGDLTLNTTESHSQFENKVSATLQNLYVYVSANTASVATVFTRIGSVNGNTNISITSGTTGVLEDTSDTDILSSGNLVNTATKSTVTTSLSITNIAIDHLTTSLQTHYISGSATGNSQGPSNSQFMGIAGTVNIGGSGLQSTVQSKIGLAFTASNLEAFVASNGGTGTSSITFQIGGANGNQALSYGSGVSGYKEDTTHTDSVGSSQEINYDWATGATGGLMVLDNTGILATYPTPSAGTLLPFPWMVTTGNMMDMTGGMRN